MHDTLLTPEQAAAKLTVAEITLRRWRKQGNGPAYIRMSGGIIRYRESDLEQYLISHTQGGGR